MAITTEDKKQFIQDHKRHDTDTGSAEVQIALLTQRIVHLTGHLQSNKKDHASRRGLLMLVGQRNSLLKFLAREDVGRYQATIKKLGLRK